MAASTPVLDEMARRGRVGAVQPMCSEWGSDAAAGVLGILGYPPATYFTGRGPLIAASLGVDMEPRDVAFCLDLVATDGERILDPTAGGIAPHDAAELLGHLAATLRIRHMEFYAAQGYRNLLVWRDGPDEISCTAPLAVGSEPIRLHLPVGDRAERLQRMMWDSLEILGDHRLNRRRRDEGLPAATMVWPWSPGRTRRLPAFGPLHGLGGIAVAEGDLARGAARLAGLAIDESEGPGRSLDSDYRLLARRALAGLEAYDLAVLHVLAPGEAALAGDFEAKVDAIERIDERLFGTLKDRIGKLDDYRILVVPDPLTSTLSRREQPGWVPFLLSGNRVTRGPQRLPFDERACEEAEWRIDEPWHLMRCLVEAEP